MSERRLILCGLLSIILLTACDSSTSPLTAVDSNNTENRQASQTEAPIPISQAKSVSDFANQIQICVTPDPATPSSAFSIEKSQPIRRGDYWMEDYWVKYQCLKTCDDWQQCAVPAYMDDDEALITHTRNPRMAKQSLSFVVDNMAGHVVFNVDESVNAKTLIIHSGGGGANPYPLKVADSLEDYTDVRTVLVRWEDGFTMPSIHNPEEIADRWGWHTRDSEEPTSMRENNRRVASLFSWIHENLAGPDMMGTLGCSMAGQATLGTVIWHGLDDIIDYQYVTGGPPVWDANAGCARRTYEHGYCVLDGTTQCKTNADCAGDPSRGEAGKGMCLYPETVNEQFDWYYEGVINHTHATTACDISEANENTQPYAPFDDTGLVGTTNGDWHFDHRIDMGAEVGVQSIEEWAGIFDPRGSGVGGDENWMAGHFMYVYNKIQPEENKQWHAIEGSEHCKAYNNGELTELFASRMGLQKRN